MICNKIYLSLHMQTLTITQDQFTRMLSGLIQSGVTFDAITDNKGQIVITFTGGY